MILNFGKNFGKKCINSPPPLIKWRILKNCSGFNRSSLRCNLRLNEKLKIALFKGNNILDRRIELISNYRHGSNYTFLGYDIKA